MSKPAVPAPEDRIFPLVVASPTPDGRPRCSGTARDGGPCGATPTTASGGRWCVNHNPEISDAERRSWRQRGALATARQRLEKERAQYVQQIVAPGAASGPQAPAAVELPPAPPETYEWGSAKLIREYLQRLAGRVASGQVSVSVANALRQLTETTTRVLDLELDERLAQRLTDGEDE